MSEKFALTNEEIREKIIKLFEEFSDHQKKEFVLHDKISQAIALAVRQAEKRVRSEYSLEVDSMGAKSKRIIDEINALQRLCQHEEKSDNRSSFWRCLICGFIHDTRPDPHS